MAKNGAAIGDLGRQPIETGTPTVIYGNVTNRGLIENLPEECCVEIPCLMDHNGVQPVRLGAIPPHWQLNLDQIAPLVEAMFEAHKAWVPAYSLKLLSDVAPGAACLSVVRSGPMMGKTGKTRCRSLRRSKIGNV